MASVALTVTFHIRSSWWVIHSSSFALALKEIASVQLTAARHAPCSKQVIDLSSLHLVLKVDLSEQLTVVRQVLSSGGVIGYCSFRFVPLVSCSYVFSSFVKCFLQMHEWNANWSSPHHNWDTSEKLFSIISLSTKLGRPILRTVALRLKSSWWTLSRQWKPKSQSGPLTWQDQWPSEILSNIRT